MRTRTTTALRATLVAAAGAALAFTLAPAPAQAQTGTLEMFSAPGINYRTMPVGDGCHTFDERMVYFADTDPIGGYVFYSGPDCSGSALGSGRDETQWIPPLRGVRSVRVQFDG